jgi:serine/threonine protein kinase
VLLDGNGRVKLSYFGVWEEVDHSVDPEAVQQFYCAPGMTEILLKSFPLHFMTSCVIVVLLFVFHMLYLEVSRGEKITFSADWWSLGVLSYELITGKVLIANLSKD